MTFLPVARVTVPAPPTGIYRGIAAAEYHSFDALNATTIGHFVRSGMHGAYYMGQTQEDDPPTADMVGYIEEQQARKKGAKK